jgi:hypothetical protein
MAHPPFLVYKLDSRARTDSKSDWSRKGLGLESSVYRHFLEVT